MFASFRPVCAFLLAPFFLGSAQALEFPVSLSAGTASQSTDLSASYLANLALNGNTGDFTHTSPGDPNPSWQVEMPFDIQLSGITLHNRDSCCGERLSDITVRLLDSSMAEVFNSGVLNAGNIDGAPATIVVNLGSTMTGRIIEVSRDGASTIGGQGVLSLGEVQADATRDIYFPLGSDLTQAGNSLFNVFQSTTLANPNNLVAGRAVDGNFSTAFPNTTHTDPGDPAPSWTVDWGEDVAIEQVVIYNRGDCCKDRLADITVEVLDAADSVVVASAILNPAPAGTPDTLTVDFTTLNGGTPAEGQKVRISRDPASTEGGNNVLSMREVVVTGGSSLFDSEPDGIPDSYESANGLNVGVNDSAADPDSDGLSNREEFDGDGIAGFSGGTDPNDPDSDGDGLLDGDELDAGTGAAAITDPLDADSDDDTLSDGDEVNNSGPLDTDGFTSDPNLQDTDSDGVNDNLDADPNSSSSDSDNDGLTDLEETSGSENPFGPNDPTDPLDADSDNDSLSDGDEIDLHGSNPNNPDTDGDGADDPTEVQFGTDPNNPANEPFVATLTSLGVGNTNLLTGDLTDPDDNGTPGSVTSASEWASVLNWNWADISASIEPYFSGFGGAQGFYDVFDGVTNDVTPGSKICCDGPPQDLSVQFLGQIALTHFTLTSSGDSPERDPRVFEIQGSNDGTAYETIYSRNFPGFNLFTARNEVMRFDLPAPSKPYSYIRYAVTATDSAQHALAEIEYLGATDTTTDTDGGGIPDYYEDFFAFLDPTVGNQADDDADQDLDGLSNEGEFLAGTNPEGTDTDNDGLSDGDEVNVYGSNPLVQDTDGDGINDGDEVSTANGFSTDPTKTDTDDDGFDDKFETDNQGSGFDPLVDSGGGDADSDGLTNDDEVTAGTDLFDPDSDDDGLNDGLEVNTHGSNPLVQDSDGDGLLDGAEVNTHNSSPTLTDTDGDNFDDNVEVAEGSLPNDAGSVPNLTKVSDAGGLLGGDITDPEDDGIQDDGDGLQFAWAGITAPDEAFFSPAGGNQGAFDLFDNAIGGGFDKWCCDGPPQNVAVEFKTPHSLTHFTVTSGGDSPNRDPKVWAIQGSDDGSSWTDIYPAPGTNDSTYLDAPWTARNQTLRFDLPSASPTYTHFRYIVTQVRAGAEHQLGEIELFGTPDTADGDDDGIPDWYENQYAFLNPNDAGDAILDQDGDMLNNFGEFALCTDPEVGAPPLVITGGDLTTPGQPVTNVELLVNDVDFSVLYQRVRDPANFGLIFIVEFSHDMSVWEPSSDPGNVVADGGGAEVLKVDYPFFLSTGRKARWWRVRVTRL